MKEVRNLREDDIEVVVRFDEMSDGNAIDFIDSDRVYGLMLDEEIIGYCTFGGADCIESLKKDENWTMDSLILSNVFIEPNFRNMGYGSYIVKEAIKQFPDAENNSIYLYLLNTKLAEFYKNLGFINIDPYTMVRI